MAQQAILAAAERRRTETADAHGFLRRRHHKGKRRTMAEALALEEQRLFELFEMWDEDGDGEISMTEFRRAIKLLGHKVGKDDFDAFCARCDSNNSGTLDLDEIRQMLEEERKQKAELAASADLQANQVRPPVERLVCSAWAVINSTACQSLLYACVVIVFQLLTYSLRMREEIYLDQSFEESILDNKYDSQLNRFEDIRREADIYTWGNRVLWPGLFFDADAACGDVGSAGIFNSSSSGGGGGSAALVQGGCNDATWPDGEGHLQRREATGWTVPEVVSRFNQLDWSDGILLRQTRTKRLAASDCNTDAIGGACHPELHVPPFGNEDTASFGYNWTQPGAPLERPFRWRSAEELGSSPAGETSAHIASLRPLAPGGFASVILPFFSAVWLPEERGRYDVVTDFRVERATRYNGKRPVYFCVRLSWDSEFVNQLCDPLDAHGRTTGVVRAAIEEFWNDLKRAHWIDAATRSVVLTMMLSSNNLGVQDRINLIFEFPSTGYVLTSFDMIPRVVETTKMSQTAVYLWLAFSLTIFFCLMELIELSGLQDGKLELADLLSYFTNVWNLMDWANYGIFFFVFGTLRRMIELHDATSGYAAETCVGLCQTVGYRDEWELFQTTRDAKRYLGLCVAIQLLKVIKFVAVLVPKMGLAPAVLKRALPDIVFFSIVFLITMLSFSTLFYIQLGPLMTEYADQTTSFISLSRALFGDFDIASIVANSNGYYNALLFISYLFGACFILLSMFFAILGESQANLREDERERRKRDKEEMREPQAEYGILSTAYEGATKLLAVSPIIGPLIKKHRLQKQVEAVDDAVKETGITAVDRIESRQLELAEKLDLILGAQQLPRRPSALGADGIDGLAAAVAGGNAAEEGAGGASVGTPHVSIDQTLQLPSRQPQLPSAAAPAPSSAEPVANEPALQQVLELVKDQQQSLAAMQRRLDEMAASRSLSRSRSHTRKNKSRPPHAHGDERRVLVLGQEPSPANGTAPPEQQSNEEERSEMYEA